MGGRGQGVGSGAALCPGRKGKVDAGMHDIAIKHPLKIFFIRNSSKVSIIIRCPMGTNVGRLGLAQDALS